MPNVWGVVMRVRLPVSAVTWLSVFVLLGWTGKEAQGQGSARPSRVVVLGPDSSAAAALVEKELSDDTRFVVLSRQDVRQLLGEQALSASNRDRVSLGRILRADLFLGIEAAGDGFSLQAIDAVTGEILGGRDGESLETVGVEARRLLLDGHAGRQRTNSTVAVIDGETDSAMGALLRSWLLDHGFRVLDRTLTLRVLEERESAAQGFREGPPLQTPFPGADVLLRIETVRDETRLIALHADGSVLGTTDVKRPVIWDETLESFLQRHLGRHGLATPTVSRQRIPPEALQPFYRGIALFEAGKPLEATAEFQRAYEASNRFVPAYLWEARCYDALELPGFAAAIRRFCEIGLVGRGAALGVDTTAREGVTFLGIDAQSARDELLAMRLTMDGIGALAGPGLFLPESLADIRDEYDLLVRASDTQGMRWETSSGFITRIAIRGSLVRDGPDPRIDFTVTDTLSGEKLARLEVAPPSGSAEWRSVLAEKLPILMKEARQSGSIRLPADRSRDETPDTGTILAELSRAGNNADRNVALLRLMLADPAHPRSIGGRLEKGSDEKDGLDNFLEQARRDWLLERLPAGHPMRPWVEFAQIQSFLPWPRNGTHITGENRDGLAALEAFSAGQPEHPARIAARYFWLYDMQDRLPLPDLVRKADALAARLQSQNAKAIPRRDDLLKLTRTLAYLARVANREADVQPPAVLYAPERFRLEIGKDAQPQLEWNDVVGFQVFVRSLFDDAEWRDECAFVIACQGKGDRLLQIEPEWMNRFPLCLGLAGHIAYAGMRAVSQNEGRPWTHMLAKDANAEREHWRRMAEYTHATLLHYLGKTQTADEFHYIDRWVQYFIHRLCSRAFREVVSDRVYARWHGELREASESAAARCGVARPNPRHWEGNMLDWRRLSREESARQLEDDLDVGPQHFHDREALLARERVAFDQAASAGGWRRWWASIDGDIAKVLSAGQLAGDVVARRLPTLLAAFGDEPLPDDDRAMLLDCGLVLMHGRSWPEAEQTLRLVAEAPMSTGSSPAIGDALRASALWHLARVLRVNGQNTEAVTALHRCLEIGSRRDIRYLWRVSPNYLGWLFRVPQGANIPALAMRTLEEMRFDPARARLPEGVGAVQVRTNQINNPTLSVFFREPRGASEKPPRVLVLVPSSNESVLPLLAQDATWAKYADTHNLVLVAPQFNGADVHRQASHSHAAFQNAQAWSGDALLRALERIQSKVHIDGERILLHGFGAGAQFAQSFSRWKPERTLALSAHSAAIWAWLENVPGQQPLATLRSVPMLFSAGELDDYGIDEANRRASTAQLVTVLRAAECTPEFHLLPGVSHDPTPDLERLAQEFLAEHLPHE